MSLDVVTVWVTQNEPCYFFPEYSYKAHFMQANERDHRFIKIYIIFFLSV